MREIMSLNKIYFKRNKILIFAIVLLMLAISYNSISCSVKVYDSKYNEGFRNYPSVSPKEFEQFAKYDEVSNVIQDGLFAANNIKMTALEHREGFMTIAAFAAFVAVLLTTLGSFDGFNIFSITLPFSYAATYLAKLIFGFSSIAIYSLASILTVYLRARQLGMSLNNDIITSFWIMLIMAMIFFLIFIITSLFTGNFIAQIVTALLFVSRLPYFLYSLLRNVYELILMNKSLPSMPDVFYDFLYNTNVYYWHYSSISINIIRLLIVAIIASACFYIAKEYNYENEVGFYKFKKAEKLFRILSTIGVSVILPNFLIWYGNQLGKIIVFLISLVIFNFFFKYIYKLKIGV